MGADPLVERHLKEYSERPMFIVEVPGVSILFGQFADSCKGYSVCCANDLKLRVAVSPRPDQMVRMFNSFSSDHKKFTVANIKFRKEDRWGNYVKGVVQSIQNSNSPVSGFNMTFAGGLLAADREMVSSAMEIATALAADRLFDLKLDQVRLIRHVFLSSTVFCHVRCRYMVLLTMLGAEKGRVLLFDNRQVCCESAPLGFAAPGAGCGLQMVESSVPPLAMREERNIKAREVKTAFEILARGYPNTNLRDLPESELSQPMVNVPEETRQICSCVLEGSRIAREAFRLLEAGDAVSVGKLLVRTQKGLRDRLDLTCPEVDWLVKRANETPGCCGASMVQTGMSGSILAVLTSGALDALKEKFTDYNHIFGFNAKTRPFVCEGGAGLLI